MTNSVETCFKITYTEDQYASAVQYVEDMKNHPKRVYWMKNEGKSDEELILSYIAHRVLSGYYHSYAPTSAQILSMRNRSDQN